MRRKRELVEQRGAFDAVGLRERGEVGVQGFRIAGNINDVFKLLQQPQSVCVHPRARRIDKHGGKRIIRQLDTLLRLRGVDTHNTRAFSIHPVIDPLHSEKHVAATVALEYAQPPLQAGHIAGGRYAVLHHCGPYADLDRVYEWFAQEWFTRAGLHIADDHPVILEYHEPCDAIPAAERRVDICIPLAG